MITHAQPPPPPAYTTATLSTIKRALCWVVDNQKTILRLTAKYPYPIFTSPLWSDFNLKQLFVGNSFFGMLNLV